MPNSSIWIGIGHLGKPAEIRDAGQSKVVSFSIAVARKRKDQETTTWFRCQWFGERAVKCLQFLGKGKAVQVIGELYEREYEKDGQKRKSLEVDVRELTLLGGVDRADSQAPAPSRPSAPASDIDDGSPPF